jgi:GT2 family glycosyltransferase
VFSSVREGTLLSALEQRGAATGGVESIEIEEATWLGASVLLLVGRLGRAGATPEALVRSDSDARAADVRAITIGDLTALVVASKGLRERLDAGAAFEIRAGDGATALDGEAFDEIVTDLQTLIRNNFAPCEAADRERIVEFVARTTGSVPAGELSGLCERLHSIREALRERLPPCVISEAQPRGLHVDRVLVVDDRSFYLEGWLHDEDSAVTAVTAVSPEGHRAEILGRFYRYSREDVAAFFAHNGAHRTKHGFLCFVELDEPSLQSEGWLLEMESSDGIAVDVPAPPLTRGATVVRDVILNTPELQRLPPDDLMAEHVYPAITRIQAQMGAPKIDHVVQFNDPPGAADVSIVVPIYRRLEFLEMQLSEFVRDPEISRADLIYVLDSPEQAEEFLDRAAQLTPLYRIPFRVVVLEENAGFAGANNVGASLANGRLLLLLNSDILPDRPGWLARMRDFYDSVPHIGALGAKLMYEDDSIQHAGMYFHRSPGSNVWHDAHYYKGMHRSLPAANVARTVPLVSGACLMIDRTLYEQLGGLRPIYVRGDYEDSDLCLRLIDSGRENWYVPDVELYHLEGQSYTVGGAEQSGDRYTANRYNAWVHTHLWDERIGEIMRDDRRRAASASEDGRGEPRSSDPR